MESGSATPARSPGLVRRFLAGAAALVATPVEAASRDVVASAKAVGRSALDITIFVLVGLVGYVFAMLGLAWLLAAHLGMPTTLLLVGGIHILVGTVGVIVLVRRRDVPPVTDGTSLAPPIAT